MDDQPLDVSVILPVYNEVGHLDTEITRIRKSLDDSPYSYEIIVVDDGSTDGSQERLREVEGIRLLSFATNRGSGSARKYGTLSARGRFVVWTDVDMTYPNDEIPALVDQIQGYDHVVGARTSEQGTVRLLRTPAKWLIRRLASYLTDTPIPDLNSGFRAFRRDVAEQFLYLLPRGFSCVTTLTMAFLANGYSVKYVPIEYFPRAGESKFHWWKDTRRYVMQVVRMTLMYEPLRVFMPAAGLVGVIAVGKLIFDWVTKDFRLAGNTLAVLGLAATLFVIGMVADLMVQLNKRRHDVMPATVDEIAA
jgi:polyisoprenyl-phosphate glycosyltransferase